MREAGPVSQPVSVGKERDVVSQWGRMEVTVEESSREGVGWSMLYSCAFQTVSLAEQRLHSQINNITKWSQTLPLTH